MLDFTGAAYVLARIERNEADLSVHLLLDNGSVQWVTAKSGSRSRKRFSAGLSPLTRYRVLISRSGSGGTKHQLAEASVERAYLKLIANLRKMTAAMTIGSIARELGGEFEIGADEHSDDTLFVSYEQSLTVLEDFVGEDAEHNAVSGAEIVRFSLDMLAHTGHGILRTHCVICGREAPPERSVQYDAESGGVRCSSCGGGPFVMKVDQRSALELVILGERQHFAPWMLRWVAYMLGAHFRGARASVEKVMSYWAG